jgi:hypothetical protein
VGLFLLARGRPVSAVWPVLALVLAPVYLTLLAPAAAAVLGRVRGPLTAAWAGAVTLVYLLLVRAPRGPFIMEQPRGRLAAGLSGADDPLTAAWRALEVVLAPPSLLQAALWAAIAAATAFTFSRVSLEGRLWSWSLTWAAVFAAYRIVPVGVWDYRAELTPLLLSVGLAAGMIVLPLVLTGGGPLEETDDGDLQIA